MNFNSCIEMSLIIVDFFDLNLNQKLNRKLNRKHLLWCPLLALDQKLHIEFVQEQHEPNLGFFFEKKESYIQLQKSNLKYFLLDEDDEQSIS